MQPPAQTFPVLSFLGVLVQLGGALMLVSLFAMLRRFTPRRAYFAAWTMAWTALGVAILALAVRYFLVPGWIGVDLPDGHAVVRTIYFIYQVAKGLGFAYFLRGTLLYVGGTAANTVAIRRLWWVALGVAVVSSFASRQGLDELVIWQSAIAVPALGYCASALFWLPRSRRTAGSTMTALAFALLAVLWLVYAGAFGAAVRDVHGPVADNIRWIVGFNSYLDLVLNLLLGYSMILLLMEDSKREIDDAQAELRVTHDQLRRAALYDSLTDSLNRRAFAEGVGLEMVRATFGTVVLADLDNLKQVNDSFGHTAGDDMLRRCSEVFRATLRAYDKLYRWGGDEFLLIVPSAHAADVLARLQNAIDTAAPVEAGVPVQGAPLQVSLGAADYGSFEELESAIERADRAMYAEKGRRKSEARTSLAGAAFHSPTSTTTVR